MYRLIRTWSDEQNCAWSTARRKLRFVGITGRTKTAAALRVWRLEWDYEFPK